MSVKKMISSSFLELASIESKYFRKKLFSKSLSCFSKKAILDSYYETIEDFIVMLSGLFQYQAAIQPNKLDKIDFRKLFNKKYESNLVQKQHIISRKISIMFRMLIEHYEILMFNEIENCFTDCTEQQYEKILNIIFDLAEIAALILSGIRFCCSNIKDEILENHKYDAMPNCKASQDCDVPCPFQHSGKECLHIVVTNETINIPEWADKILSIFAKYFANPKELSIFIDYKLVDYYEWNEEKYEVFKKFYDIFGGYYFVNADTVNFGKWENEVDIVPFSHLSSCILS